MAMVFADTSYWIALLNPHDELHARAFKISRELRAANIVTSEMVLVELLNSFSDAGGGLREAAAIAIETMRQRTEVKIVPQTTEQFEYALQRYKKAADKSWSITDCASVQIMEEAGIRIAATYDRHFLQAGYEAILR